MCPLLNRNRRGVDWVGGTVGRERVWEETREEKLQPGCKIDKFTKEKNIEK